MYVEDLTLFTVLKVQNYIEIQRYFEIYHYYNKLFSRFSQKMMFSLYLCSYYQYECRATLVSKSDLIVLFLRCKGTTT